MKCQFHIIINCYISNSQLNRIRFNAYESLLKMVTESYELYAKYGMDGFAHFTLAPTTPSSHGRAIVKFGQSYESSARLSKYFHYFQSAHILAGKMKCNILVKVTN